MAMHPTVNHFTEGLPQIRHHRPYRSAELALFERPILSLKDRLAPG